MDSNEMITLLSQILDERIGMVTAYAYAKSKGYAGSADDFANDMANIGVNISAIETAINTFNNQTVPNAETAITTAGSNQVNAVNEAGQEQLQNVTAEGGRQVGLVAAAGSAQTETVNAAGASQVENVNTAGTTQVTNINNAGETQITAIQTKGEQTRATIPADYTALSDSVEGLKESLDKAESYYFPNDSDQLFDALHATAKNWYINNSTLKIKENSGCRSVVIPVDPTINAKVTLTKAYDSQFMVGQLNTTTPTVDGDVIKIDSVASYIHTITVELDSSAQALLVWYWYNNAADPDDVLKSMMVTYGEHASTYAPYRTIYHYDEYEKASKIANSNAGNVEESISASGVAVLSAVADLVNFDTDAYPVKVCVSGKNMCYPWLNAKTNQHEITANGITTTDNEDGSFTISGASSATVLLILCKIPFLPKGTYVCNGTNFGLGAGKARIDIREGSSGATVVAQGDSDIGFTFTLATDTSDLNVCMRIGAGNSINTKIYPMVRNSAVADNTFVIYSPVQHIEASGKSDVLALGFYETTVITVTDANGNDVDFLTVHRANLKTYIDKTVIGNRLFVAGDSITAGHPTYTIRWYEAVQKKYHYVVGGVRQVGAGFSFYNGVNACKIARQTDFTQYDIAIFAFGTNDYGNNIPLGTIDDTYTYSEDSSQTFYACVKYVVEKALTDNSKLILVFSLPINRSSEGSFNTNYAFGTANAESLTLKDYCEAIVAVCEKYGIPYISHYQSAFNAYTLPSLLVDGLHPNEDGYRVLSQEMIAKLGAVIQPYQKM